jgi:uncharacterized membrane protein
VYPSVKRIVNFFFSGERIAFKKVVLVEYPRKGIWSLGFITNDGFRDACDKTKQELVNVFFPTSPSPLTGYVTFVPKNDIVLLDISIEDGLRLVVSGGVVNPATGKEGDTDQLKDHDAKNSGSNPV